MTQDLALPPIVLQRYTCEPHGCSCLVVSHPTTRTVKHICGQYHDPSAVYTVAAGTRGQHRLVVNANPNRHDRKLNHKNYWDRTGWVYVGVNEIITENCMPAPDVYNGDQRLSIPLLDRFFELEHISAKSLMVLFHPNSPYASLHSDLKKIIMGMSRRWRRRFKCCLCDGDRRVVFFESYSYDQRPPICHEDASFWLYHRQLVVEIGLPGCISMWIDDRIKRALATRMDLPVLVVDLDGKVIKVPELCRYLTFIGFHGV